MTEKLRWQPNGDIIVRGEPLSREDQERVIEAILPIVAPELVEAFHQNKAILRPVVPA